MRTGICKPGGQQLGVLLVILAGAATDVVVCTPAAAQSATPSNHGRIEDIVVTARKRSERAQKVPIAITVLSSADLQHHTVQTLGDLQQLTPSFTLQPDAYSSFGVQVGLRGQKQTDTLLNTQPAVGIYLDGVYVASTQGGLLANLFDISQINVLKGPQGTLFGRNTTGGALLVTTEQPNYNGINGVFKAGVGNEGFYEINQAVNIPIVPDKMALRIAAQYFSNDGYAKDVVSGRSLGDQQAPTVRAALRIDPNEDLNIVLRADYSNGHSGGRDTKIVAVDPNGYGALDTALQEGFFTAAGAPDTVKAARYLLATQPSSPYRANYSLPIPGFHVLVTGFSATETYNVTPDISLKSITAYRYSDLHGGEDSDASSVPLLDSGIIVRELHTLSQEITLSGKAINDRLNWTLGAYYFNETGQDTDDLAALPALTIDGFEAATGVLLPPGFFPFTRTNAYVHDTSGAVYAQGTYSITPKLHLTLGVRGTTEAQNLYSNNTSALTGCTDPNGGPDCLERFGESSRNLSYNATVDYQITPNALVYARTARGYKGGGVNERGGSTSDAYSPFAPEEVTDYEVGAKTDLFDRHLRFNADYYHSEYKDIQRTVVVGGGVGGGEAVTSITVNAASATIDGVEAEMTAIPIDGVTLHADGAFTDTKYNKYLSENAAGTALVSLAGNSFPDTPKFQYDVSAAYSYPTPVGALRAEIDWSWQSLVDFQPDNHSAPGVAPPPGWERYSEQPDFGPMNARVSLDIDPYKANLAFYIKNALNKKYLVGALDLEGAGLGLVTDSYGQPLTFGFELTKRF